MLKQSLAVLERQEISFMALLVSLSVSCLVIYFAMRFQIRSLVIWLISPILCLVGFLLSTWNLWVLFHHFSSIDQFIADLTANTAVQIVTINLGFTIILSIVWILYDSSRWGFSWLQRILLLIFSVWAPTVSTPMHVVNIFTAEVDFGHKPPRTSWTMFYLYSTLSLVSLFAVLPLWTIYARDAAAMEVFLKLSPSLPPLTSFLLQSQASWLSSITVRTLVTLIPPLVGWSSQVSGSFGFLLFLPLSFVCLPCVVAGSLALKELRYLYEKSIE